MAESTDTLVQSRLYMTRDCLMRVLIIAVIFTVSLQQLALGATTEQQLQQQQHDYYLLEYLRLTYSEEVFDYCVDKHGTAAGSASNCMIKQDKVRTKILDEALDQLGRHSLAQAVYDDCVDYYPRHSVERIRQCVLTRLDLRERLDDDLVEKTIYDFCDGKWRDHGYRSVGVCASAQARYFLRTGNYRD